MEDSVYLCKPSVKLKEEYISFYEEWNKSGEKFVPWVTSIDPSDFTGMIELLLNNEDPEHLPDGHMPSSTYWMVTDSCRILGVINIRHKLLGKAVKTRGHFGYGIRPSERRKGYASKLVSLSLSKAKELGIKRALIICHEDNKGSQKTILKNGGVQSVSHTDENGDIFLRYWIDL